MIAAATDANADEPSARSPKNGDAGLYVLYGAIAINGGFTIYNLATIGGDKPGIYGFGETMLALPQTVVFGSIALLTEDSDGAWLPATLALWTAALATHGIYTLASGGSESTARSSDRAVLLSFGGRF